ncbi:MAG: hypothetical protein E8D46_04505 [Nitrospira sp.]|nr:MAG: hypothetical protein E8D46_04505 [Nitrospira sp.]
MKLLESINMGRHRSSRWAMLGGIMLWMSVLIASPAQAVPTNYEIVPGGFFSGTFTLDPAGTINPFTIWNITPSFPLSTPAIISPTFTTNFGNGAGFAQLTRFDGLLQFTFTVLPSLQFIAFHSADGGSNSTSQVGTFRVADATVPEPTAAILLAIGLLALAGSRWLPGRREQ